MSHSFTNLLYHIVFSTKQRQPLIKPDYADHLYQYIGGIIRKEGGIALLTNGMPDHVHILAKLKPGIAPADSIRKIKTNSSRWLHESMPQLSDVSWQTGYGAFTVSLSQADRVQAYIQNQPQHHETITFEEEYEALLKAHNIPYDPRFLWRES